PASSFGLLGIRAAQPGGRRRQRLGDDVASVLVWSARNRPREARDGSMRRDSPWSQAPTNEQQRGTRPTGDLSPRHTDPFITPTFGEAADDESGVLGRADDSRGAGLHEQRLGRDTDGALNKERRARE